MSCSLSSEEGVAEAEVGVSFVVGGYAEGAGVSIVLDEDATPRISDMAVAFFDARPFDAICLARCARRLYKPTNVYQSQSQGSKVLSRELSRLILFR